MKKSEINDNLQKIARERTVKTQTIEYDLFTLVNKIKNGIIKLDPEYQRKHRWKDEISSRLIESLILNIPIPMIFISQDIDVDEETEVARYSVIDGQQRLTAIYNFMENKYKLIDLNILTALNGKYYNQLPPFLVRRLEERTIKCLRIDSTVDEQVKYDIFERLNSGSVQLTSQELRNAIYRGKFNELIKSLATNDTFRKLLQIDKNKLNDNTKVQKMEDVELVLRFFALDDGRYKNYIPNMKDYLNNSMERFNKLSTTDYTKLEVHFLEVFEYIRENLGDKAFAKYRIDGTLASSFNTAVYDAVAIGVSTAINKPNKTKRQIGRDISSLFKLPDFQNAIGSSMNDKEKIVKRIDMVHEVIMK